MDVDGQDSTFSDIFTKLNLVVPQASLYILFIAILPSMNQARGVAVSRFS